MRFIIASRSEAQKLLLSTTTEPTIGAVVSIGGMDDPMPGGVLRKPHLRLVFDDVSYPGPASIGYIPPSEMDIKRLIDSAPSLLAQNGKILCHCQAGISRSSAAAYILNSISKGPGHEEEALIELLHAYSRIHPNRLMIQIASKLLENPALIEIYDGFFGRI